MISFQMLVPSGAERVAKAALNIASAKDPFVALIASVGPQLTAGTKFENRWQVNRPYNAKDLNIYVVKLNDGSPSILMGFRGNCSAVTNASLIVCDSQLFSTFLQRYGIPATSEARRSFIAWVIGHEIGHVVHGDGPAHFEPNSLEAQIASASLDHRQELGADAFLARQLARDPELRYAVEEFALDLLNSEIRRKIGPQNLPPGVGVIFDYTNEYVVRYFKEGTHPEFVVRSARLLDVSSRSTDNESLRQMVAPLIRQLGGH